MFFLKTKITDKDYPHSRAKGIGFMGFFRGIMPPQFILAALAGLSHAVRHSLYIAERLEKMTIEGTDKTLSLGGKETENKDTDGTVPPREGSLQTERIDSKKKD